MEQRRSAPKPAAGQVQGATATSIPPIYLHIGTFKAGTSYLQGRLGSNVDALRRDGVLFPGPLGYPSQVSAVRDILGWEVAGSRGEPRTPWTELRDEMHAWRGRCSVVSMEFLSAANRRKVTRIVESLAPAEVHVIVTARDLARVLPSAWQEQMQNRNVETWSEFIDGAMSDTPSQRDSRFWATHDVNEIVQRWLTAVDREHLAIVTVPPSGAPPDLLWERFCSVLGIDPSRYGTDLSVGRSNTSLDTASAELMRRINAKLPEEFSRPAYGRHVKHFLAKESLSGRPGGRKPALPQRYQAWAGELNEQIVRGLADSGARVVGDLDELRPPPSVETDGSSPDDATEAEVAAAAVDAVVALLQALASATGSRPAEQRVSSAPRRPSGQRGRARTREQGLAE